MQNRSMKSANEIIPAQPGWFVFDLDSAVSETDYTLKKAPIVAWLVTIEFYPETERNRTTSAIVRTGQQNKFVEVAQPVSTAQFEHDENVTLAPDGCVYHNNGRCWPDIASYIRDEIKEWDACEARARDAATAKAKETQPTQTE
jgi:hypothetical protein